MFGVFPTTEEPNAPVIWEAFQPQTELRRSNSVGGDPYNRAAYQQALQQRLQEIQEIKQRQAAAKSGAPQPATQPPVLTQPAAAGVLPTQNAVQ